MLHGFACRAHLANCWRHRGPLLWLPGMRIRMCIRPNKHKMDCPTKQLITMSTGNWKWQTMSSLHNSLYRSVSQSVTFINHVSSSSACVCMAPVGEDAARVIPSSVRMSTLIVCCCWWWWWPCMPRGPVLLSHACK